MDISDLKISQVRLKDICSRYNVTRLEAFGSFTRGNAGPESDLDILVTFDPATHIGLLIVNLQQELEALFGRKVDLLTRTSVERSSNKYFRRFALQTTEPIFERA